MKKISLYTLTFILAFTFFACGSDSGGGGSKDPVLPGDTCSAPDSPAPASTTIVNCLYWPASHAYAEVRVRVNWTDVTDETGYLITVRCEGEGVTQEIHEPADIVKDHIDITIGDAGPTDCSFYIEAYNATCYSAPVDAGTVPFAWDAFNYCTNNPPG